jgi:hypothetical protein
MEIAILLGGSLVAVLLLALVAKLLRLGGGSIADVGEAKATAEALLSGFEAERAVVGHDGQAALVHGRDGSVALLKMHGSRIAARRLATLRSEATPDGLRVETGERRFGNVLLKGIDAP